MVEEQAHTPTLKDIAKQAGVAVVTVHKAIYGKPGISARTRERILQIVEEMHFSVNPIAASLKREMIRIAVVYPMPEPHQSYFYREAARGIDAAEQELSPHRCAILRCPCDSAWQSQRAILSQLAAEALVDGVVIYCLDDTLLNPCIAALHEKGIPVFTFNSDAQDSCRIGSVTAPNERMGALAAEFLCRIVRERSRVILFGGNRMRKNLRENSLGFFRYIQQNRPDLLALEINDLGHPEDLQREMERAFTAYGDISGVYCNSARSDLPLCRAVESAGLRGKVTIVTNDVFAELLPYFENNTIQATLWQDPKSQAYLAIRALWQSLAFNRLDQPHEQVKIAVVMGNNFADFL